MTRRFLSICVFLVFASSASAVGRKMYDADNDRIFEDLQERLAATQQHETVPVIVVYRPTTPLAGTIAVRLNRITSKMIRYTYRNLPAVAVSFTPAQINETLKDPWIEHIELDTEMRISMNQARSSFGVDALNTQFGFSGDGDKIKDNYSKEDFVIAVIDTGVNRKHPDVAGKILFWKDYVNGRTKPYDDNGHGTMVSGIATGTGKLDGKYAGVAPQTALVVIKAFSFWGAAAESDIIAAIDEVIERKPEYKIRVLNLSFESAENSAGTDAVSLVCNRAVETGIVVVAAAGNFGPNRSTMPSPAAASGVIAVGAGADLGARGFFLADFSSRGPTADGRIKPELWAPGVRITAPKNDGYAKGSGTSFAAPFVAGVVALMLEANPDLTPEQVKTILQKTAVRWGPGKKNSEAGAGRLQAYYAVTSAAGIRPSRLDPPDVPEVLYQEAVLFPNQDHTYTVDLADTRFPMAITVIAFDYPLRNLTLELIGPDGKKIATRSRDSRQQTLKFKPKLTGSYRVILKTTQASATYLLNLSGDFSN